MEEGEGQPSARGLIVACMHCGRRLLLRRDTNYATQGWKFKPREGWHCAQCLAQKNATGDQPPPRR